jgi:hypothetical protein
MDKLKVMLLATTLSLASCTHETSKAVIDTPESIQSRPLPSQDCLYSLWKKLLPLMARNNNYISIEDMEHVAGVKMQHVVNVSPTDVVGIYEQFSLPSTNNNFSPYLSLRVETHEEALPYNKAVSTWRALQWQYGSTSTVDVSCSSTLSVKEAEGDLRALGLHPAGTLSRGIQRAEVFVSDWNEQTYLYYTIPTITTPPVSSIRIIGMKTKRPPVKWPQ